MSDKDFLVVGLGNIGPEYACTRHNMGFIVLDAWAQASDTVFTTGRYGDMCTISAKGRHFHLLKPSTYMNLSGNAVRYWMQEQDIDLKNVVIICDDLNLPFGTVRMRGAGSDGGHNGLKNIQELLCSQDYARIRIGIGNQFTRGQQIDFVLGRLSDEELKQMETISQDIIAGVKSWALAGLQTAMTALNTKKKTQNAENQALK